MTKVEIKRLDSVTANDTTATLLINNNFKAIQDALENTLSRDGTTPNFMDANLDLNSYKIINSGEATDDNDVVTLKLVKDAIGTATESAEAAANNAKQAATSAQSAQVSATNAITAVRNAEETIVQATELLNGTQTYVDNAKVDINNTVAKGKADIEDTKNTAIGTIDETVSTAKGNIANTVVSAKADITNTANNATNEITSTVTQAKSDVNTAINEATMDISNTSTAAISTINTAVSNAESNISAIVSDAEGSITNIAVTEANKAIANAAQEATDTATANVNNYVNNTILPPLQTYVGQAQADANSAATSMEQAALSATAASNYASNASADADNAAESASLASADAGSAAKSAELAQQIKDSLGSVYVYKGSVNSYSDLPGNATTGDVYNVVSNGKNYAWTGSEWDDLGGTVDLSEYQKTADADSKYATKDSLNSLQGSKQDISNLSQTLDDSTTKYPSNKAVKTAIDAKDSLPSQTGNSGKFLTTDGSSASWKDVSGVGNIGDIKYTARTDTPEGGAWCDGAEYTQAAFPDLYQMLVGGKLQSTTYTDFNNQVSTNGYCSLFALNTATTSFKVPSLPDKYVIDTNTTAPVVGNGMTFGLTDGQRNGGLTAANIAVTSGTPFYNGIYGNPVGTAGSTYPAAARSLGVTSDPAKSGIVADTSSTGKFVTLKAYVVLYASAAGASVAQAAEFMTALGGKANVTLDNVSSNIDYVVERGESGNDWWEIHKSGKKRQGGILTTNSGTKTFPKPFSKVYGIFMQNIYTASGNETNNQVITNYGNTDFSYKFKYGTCFWVAEGK